MLLCERCHTDMSGFYVCPRCNPAGPRRGDKPAIDVKCPDCCETYTENSECACSRRAAQGKPSWQCHRSGCIASHNAPCTVFCSVHEPKLIAKGMPITIHTKTPWECTAGKPTTVTDPEETTPAKAPVDRKPPSRRKAVIYTIEIKPQERDKIKSHIILGFYDDDSLCEIEVTTHKTGSDLRTAYDAWAMTASRALQCGTPVKVIAEAVRHIRDAYAGEVSSPEHLRGRQVTSLWDAIGLLLEEETS